MLFSVKKRLTMSPWGPELYESLFGLDSLVDHVLSNRERYRLQFMVSDIIETDSVFVLGETYDYSVPQWCFILIVL
jgi:hypothetical protein